MVLDRRRPTQSRDAHLARLETVGELSAAFVHDFNNLLTVIAGYAELLATELEPGPTREAAREIRSAAERAASVSARLLEFVRPSKNPAVPTVIDAGSTVTSLRPLAARLAGPNHPVVMKLDRRALPLVMDARDLELALLNLVINARQAAPAGTPIVIGAERLDPDPPGENGTTKRRRTGIRRGAPTRGGAPDSEGGEPGGETGHALAPAGTIVIFVSDRGPGVPQAMREQVFEPFFTTRGDEGGTGLGLAIVRRTARRWGGEARIRAHRGGGARFELILPLAEEH